MMTITRMTGDGEKGNASVKRRMMLMGLQTQTQGENRLEIVDDAVPAGSREAVAKEKAPARSASLQA